MVATLVQQFACMPSVFLHLCIAFVIYVLLEKTLLLKFSSVPTSYDIRAFKHRKLCTVKTSEQEQFEY